MRASATVPIRTVNALNAREHWAVRHRRNTHEATAVSYAIDHSALCDVVSAYRHGPPSPVVVELVRIGKRRMDDDGLVASLKAVRDEIARRLGVDDGDGLIRFVYGQESGQRYGVRITIEHHGDDE